jgi:hypothetical protein
MIIRTDLQDCSLRPWQSGDKAALVRNGNNRKVWRNLTDLFPHPYTEADADYWLSFANRAALSVHLAIEFEGEAVGGIGIIAGEGKSRSFTRMGSRSTVSSMHSFGTIERQGICCQNLTNPQHRRGFPANMLPSEDIEK